MLTGIGGPDTRSAEVADALTTLHTTLTKEQRRALVDLVRGSADEAFDRSIDVHVSHLRRKLGDDPRSPRLLKIVRGIGYLLGTDRG